MSEEKQHDCPLADHDIVVENLVSKEICSEKHRWNLWAFGILFALMSLFLAISGISLAYANSATSDVGKAMIKSGEVQSSLNVHVATQIEHDKAVVETLKEIRVDLAKQNANIQAQREEQLVILEKLLQHDEDH